MPPQADVQPRLLRAFLAVADELHFTRAAARLYLAQQALSRDVRRLERELGAQLFVRSTRSVVLTPEGERLVPLARRLLDAHDALRAAFATPGPLLVDVNSPGLLGERVVAHARTLAAPGAELVVRYESGLTHAAAEIHAGRLDASFGRFAGLPPALAAGLGHQPVAYERMGVVLPAGHPLAALPEVPVAALAGEEVYAGAGNARTAEWTALAEELFAPYGIALAPPAPLVVGEAEFARVMAEKRRPVLSVTGLPALAGSVLRPLVEPVPLSPVSLVWRAGRRHPGLDVLREAATALAGAESWLIRPPFAWLPTKDALIMMSPAQEAV